MSRHYIYKIVHKSTGKIYIGSIVTDETKYKVSQTMSNSIWILNKRIPKHNDIPFDFYKGGYKLKDIDNV